MGGWLLGVWSILPTFLKRIFLATTSYNFVALEAFRRWVLAQLLEDGKPTGIEQDGPDEHNDGQALPAE